MISAGSPGSNCCSEKMITDTKNNVGISCSSRLPRNVSIARRRSLQLEPDHAHEPVGHLRIALKLGCMRDQHAAMIKIKLRDIGQDDPGDLFIDRLALARV